MAGETFRLKAGLRTNIFLNAIAVAAADGRLWELWFTAVPEPEQTNAYITNALAGQKDGVIRHHQARRDGTARDTVIYSILASEWPDVKRHLELRLARHGSASS